MFKKSKKYYLEKMRHGQITDKEVAEIFNTSTLNVRTAFVEYSKRKNPFFQHRHRFIDIIQILISIISVALVYFTLLEMQVARNSAYRPDIYFSKTSFAISWDANGTLNSDLPDDPVFQALCQSTDYVNVVPQIELINIGMGTAKNIHLEWQHSYNMNALTSFLYTNNSEAQFSYTFSNHFIVIESNGTQIQSTSRPSLDITYMKNEPQNDMIGLPFEYWECIRHICINYAEGGLFLPNVEIELNYSDIQGKVYHVKKQLGIKPYILSMKSDNSGYAVLEIIEI